MIIFLNSWVQQEVKHLLHNLRPNSVNSLTEQLGCNTVHSIHRLNPASRYDISELFSISSETFHSAKPHVRTKKREKKNPEKHGDIIW